MRAILRDGILIGAVCLCGGAMAAEPETIAPQPGQWEVRTTFTAISTGLPMPLPPKVVNLCLGKDDFVTSKFAVQSMPSCAVKSGKQEGNALKLDVACANPNVKFAKANLDIVGPTGLRGNITVNMGADETGKIVEFIYSVDGRRLGDCAGESKEEVKKP